MGLTPLLTMNDIKIRNTQKDIRRMRGLITALAFVIIAVTAASASSRFFETWDWQSKYKSDKVMPDDWEWGEDLLPGYESRFVRMPDAFDGPVRCTIIRRLVDKRSGGSRKAFLYVHGFNDYFFQSEMGELMNDSGYNFYAVDLRRYGRSRLPWQYPFNVRKQHEFFEDIDSALVQIRRDGNTDITLGGHSTGGLTVLYYAAMRGRRAGVDRVVTNSPFIEWNYSAFMRDVAANLVEGMGHIFPNAKIKQSHCDGYAYSLLKQYDGEWEYNTDWKMIYSPPVTMSWVGAINHAQRDLIRNGAHITVPILVMTSSRAIYGCNYTPEFSTGDCVLNPEMIRRQAARLASDSTRVICEIDSGLHDLILSRPSVRRKAYDTMFTFMRQN